MDDGDVLIISSSPEPEEHLITRLDKGKGRATNDEPLDLGSDSDIEVGSSSLGANPCCALDPSQSSNNTGPSNDHQPVASGSGATIQVVEDPVEAIMLQVLDIIPNVDSEHLRSLVVLYQSQNHEDVGTAIISQLLENPDYPKSTNKRKVNTDAQSPGKRARVDYLAADRQPITDVGYMNLSLDHLLRVDFPTIPKEYVTRTFFGQKSLYAPAYIVLKQDLEDGSKFVPNKSAKRAEPSRRKAKSKAKALPESKDFERERRWLLQYLDEKAELEECERDGTGVECGCCFGDYPFSWMVQCPEAHLFCRDCARRSAEECIGNRKTELVCMDQSGCKLPFAESEVERFLSGPSLELWHRIKQEREIELAQIDGLESCPFCSYAVVIENDQERLFRCENASCEIVSCRACKKEDHLPKSCEEAEKDKVLDARHAVEEAMTKALMRNCPKCGQNFVKESGCNKMTCPKCRSLSCYVCRKLIRGYEHFDQTPQGAPRQGQSSKCPLWDSVDQRHADEVKRAAEAAQEEFRRQHPELDDQDLAVDLPAAPAPPPAAPAPARALPLLGAVLPNPALMPHNPVQQANFMQQAVLQHGLHYRGLGGMDMQQIMNQQMERARRMIEEQNAELERERQRLQALVEERQRLRQQRQQQRAAPYVMPPPPPPPARRRRG